MTNCYKCGAEIPGPNPECDDCTNGVPFALEDRAPFREIDWSKVITPEDVRLIFGNVKFHLHLSEDHPAFEQLKRFLKD